ncbi:glycerophosphodiester phosphodiesterase [Fulvivirgaceae bacterium BMA12]|uniref:Glycerophosphodiester phosphodiesterase n=1 Tax=Agaribacillus aureus TaxID=3051825 RepID=A0ABT8LHE3_9BACT|nr:glycerophosphodiester phosphodiesterase [Fulvivirgaceae bacterium BMA12]
MNYRKVLLPTIFLMLVLPYTALSQKVDIQGHRGARGLLPENTINAFIKAVDLGVTTLELDVVISKDKQVVISHEPYMSGAICTDQSGQVIESTNEKSHNIYEMNYETIRKYDCGISGNPRFPEQEKVTAHKPLLSEMIEVVEKHIKENNLAPVNYNIEIKSNPKGDNIYHPAPAKFSDLVYTEVQQSLPWERVIIQSFDHRVLQYLHEKDAKVTLAFLVGNKLNYKSQLKKLGFTPAIYSPYYKLLDAETVSKLQKKGMKVIPWTVNDLVEMKLMIEWGVDGIITDYPNRAVGLK